MFTRTPTHWFVATMIATGLLPGARAFAHISLEQGGTHMSRYGDDEIKGAPCGRANGQRGTNVYTYKPGETIQVTIAEFIPHPGYFRIAFDNDGDDDFEEPATTDGEFGNCAGDPKCGAGMTDYCNNDTVLLDHLDPHASSGFGNAPEYTWSVTLPNVECDNCTLQILQVMNDLNVHVQPYPGDDIYSTCIDLVLSNDADEVTDAPVTNDGMDCTGGEPQGGAGGTGGAGGAGAGGAGAGGAGSGGAGSGGASGSTAGAGAGGAGVGAAGSSVPEAGAGAGGVGGNPAQPPIGMAGTGAGAGGVAGPVPATGGGSDSGGCSATGPSRAPGGAIAFAFLLACAVLVRRRARRRSGEK